MAQFEVLMLQALPMSARSEHQYSSLGLIIGQFGVLGIYSIGIFVVIWLLDKRTEIRDRCYGLTRANKVVTWHHDISPIPFLQSLINISHTDSRFMSSFLSTLFFTFCECKTRKFIMIL